MVPIFETLRRSCCETSPSLRLAALSGSVVLIPSAAKPALEILLSRTGSKCSIKDSSAPGYSQVTVSGSEETASGLLTELFYQGEIQVLIGTKSLLGEGWDSPCINSLILASFVDSFMLSNQMRGTAWSAFLFSVRPIHRNTLQVGMGLFRPFFVAALITFFVTVKRGMTAKNLASPLRFLRVLGKGILSALEKVDAVTSEHLSVGAEIGEDGVNYIYLRGGTEREKDVFAQCILELFASVTNQRYLLCSKAKDAELNKYYCIPELFARRKEDAALFAHALTPCIGAYELVYTKGGDGRNTLLAARLQSLAYVTGHGVEEEKMCEKCERGRLIILRGIL